VEDEERLQNHKLSYKIVSGAFTVFVLGIRGHDEIDSYSALLKKVILLKKLTLLKNSYTVENDLSCTNKMATAKQLIISLRTEFDSLYDR
jgi:hypothetical protein